jgi:hypothetical protein
MSTSNDSNNGFDSFLVAAKGTEPFQTAFRNTAEGLRSTDPEVRMVARHEWVAFMRAHADDYFAIAPDMIPDLIEILEHLLSSRKRRDPAFVADMTALLEAARRYHPTEEADGE